MNFDVINNYLISCGYGDRVMQFDVSSATVELAAKAEKDLRDFSVNDRETVRALVLNLLCV